VIRSGGGSVLWFTERDGNKIGEITTSGKVTEFTVPTADSGPSGICIGPDSAIWFTEDAADKVGRMTTTGKFTEYVVPTPSSKPGGIAPGADGALWFVEFNGNKIGRVTTAGSFYRIQGANRECWPVRDRIGQRQPVVVHGAERRKNLPRLRRRYDHRVRRARAERRRAVGNRARGSPIWATEFNANKIVSLTP